VVSPCGVRLVRLLRSEGFPLMGYFILGRDGIGVWQDSRLVCPSSSSADSGPHFSMSCTVWPQKNLGPIQMRPSRLPSMSAEKIAPFTLF